MPGLPGNAEARARTTWGMDSSSSPRGWQGETFSLISRCFPRAGQHSRAPVTPPLEAGPVPGEGGGCLGEQPVTTAQWAQPSEPRREAILLRLCPRSLRAGVRCGGVAVTAPILLPGHLLLGRPIGQGIFLAPILQMRKLRQRTHLRHCTEAATPAFCCGLPPGRQRQAAGVQPGRAGRL